jgi:hypothetical protein
MACDGDRVTVIVRDVFPAQLVDPPADMELPAGRVRAVATVGGTLLLLIESGAGIVRREFTYDIDASDLGQVWSARPARFVLTDGRVLDVRRGGGCGCGSRLRSLEPFPEAGPMTVAG